MVTVWQRDWIRFFSYGVLVLVLLWTVGGCSSPEPPSLSLSAGSETGSQITRFVGEDVSIIANITPPVSVDLTWSVAGNAGGTLSNTSGPSTVYTTGQAGTDIVTVSGTAKDGTPVQGTISIVVTDNRRRVTLGGLGAGGEKLVQDGGTYPCMNIAKGTYAEGIEGQIWVVVGRGSRYHVQDYQGQRPPMSEGRWRSEVRLGNCEELDKGRGEEFQILVVVADDQASQTFEDYLEAGRQTGDYSGLEALPEGAEEHVRLFVTRE